VLPEGVTIDGLRAGELPTLVAWAAAEGWNPADGDLELARQLDPDAFLALRRDGELIGTGSVFSYDGAFGFMGCFIVRPDLRGEGLGTGLWYARRDRMVARLRPGAAVGMDGVFAMVPFYERGGFRLAYRDLRFEGMARGEADPGVVPLARLPFEQVEAYDRRHVPAPRPGLLAGWLGRPGVRASALVEDGELVAYGALRPATDAWRIGPLFADRPDAAERVLLDLLAGVEGEPVHLDVPEPNEAGLALVAGLGMAESFGCARMYLGTDPGLPVERIFGVTSFELG
jgi:hypothetical protein